MKVEKRGDDFELFLHRREKEILLHILELYPRTPPAHHRLTETVASPDLEASRRLLDESIVAGRKEARQKLENWLAEPGRFTAAEKGFRLKIKAEDLEWLMQVLNEIRVGSWIRIGSPENEPDMNKVTPENAADFGVMHISGSFVMFLLEAIRGNAA